LSIQKHNNAVGNNMGWLSAAREGERSSEEDVVSIGKGAKLRLTRKLETVICTSYPHITFQTPTLFSPHSTLLLTTGISAAPPKSVCKFFAPTSFNNFLVSKSFGASCNIGAWNALAVSKGLNVVFLASVQKP
jgi:hypothetical protein